MKPKGFASADYVTPRQGQGQWKCYKMVEVNSTYNSTSMAGMNKIG